MKAKFLLLPVVFLFLFYTNKSTAQVQSIVPGSNPPLVVKLGDPVAFPVSLFNGSGSALGATELEIVAPAGWEIISATPALKAGSLTPDKLKARVTLTIGAMSQTDVTFMLKPLCSAVPEAGALTYNWYQGATLLATKNSASIGNFIDPIIRFTPSADKNTRLNKTATRIWSVEQTAAGSYISNLTIDANCNKTTLTISKLEVVNNATGTTVLADITAAALDASQAGKYVYTLNANVFNKIGNLNGKLEATEILYIRETYVVKDCNSSNVAYSSAYGDGTNFCSYTTPQTAVIAVEQPGYNPDITTLKFGYPAEDGSNGKVTVRLFNNSTDAEANMYNVLVAVYNTELSQFDYKRAYFSDENGDPVAGMADIPLVNNRAPSSHAKKWFVSFDQLPNVSSNPTEAAKYAALGLSDLDGDGIYDDLAPGRSLTITTEYSINFDRFVTDCVGEFIQPSSTRRADLYYENTCNTYQLYTRGYAASSGLSTNMWVGEFKYPRPAVVLSKLNVSAGDALTLTVNETSQGNGNSGYPTLYAATTTNHSVYLRLPKGFTYDATAGVKVVFSGTTYTVVPTDITVLSTSEIQFRNRFSISMGQSYVVGVMATSEVADVKDLQIKHLYSTPITLKTHVYGCYIVPVSFEQIQPCSRLELSSFSAERTTFGWTNSNETTRATSATPGIDVKVAGPYDNVSMTGTASAKTNIVFAASEKLYAELTYEGASGATNYYFSTGQGARLRYKSAGASGFGADIVIPASSIIQSYDAPVGTTLPKHTLLIDLSPYVGSGKTISTLNTNDQLQLVFLTQTTEALPYLIQYVNNLQMRVYTKQGAVETACNGLVEKFKIVNYRMANGQSGNNSATYNTNTLSSNLNILHIWLEGNVGYPGVSFPNEFRPNASISNLSLTLNSLVEPVSLTNNAGTLLPAAYSVSYSSGKTTISFANPIKDEVFSNQWTGYNYNMRWNTICWNTEATAMSYNISQYPTSENPQAKTVTVTSSLSLTTTDYAYTLTCTNPSINSLENTAQWELLLTNRSQWANTDPLLPNSWISVELPTGVTPVDLIDVSTGLSVGPAISYGSNEYWWKMGDQNVPTSKKFKLVCSYTICTGTPSLTARYGMSKVAYPVDPAQGYSQYNSGLCNATAPITLSFTPAEVNFSSRLLETGKNGNGKYTFCEPITFEATFTNGLASKVYNMKTMVKLPDGMLWVGGARVKKGNGSYTTIPAGAITTVGRNVTISLGSVILDGYETGGNPDASATLEFKLKTTCGFTSGTAVYAEMSGESGCGAVNTTYANSGQINIEGLSTQNSSYGFEVTSYTSTPSLVNSTPDKVRLTGYTTLVSSSSTPNDYVFIDLPPNMQLSSGGALPKLVFTQVGTRLSAKLPTATFGGTSDFEIELSFVQPDLWNCESYDIIFRHGVEEELPCVDGPGGQCKIIGIGDNTLTKSFTVVKQDIGLLGITFDGKYKNASSETITVRGNVKNNAAAAISGIRLALYADNNGNGILDAGDAPATGAPQFVTASITAGGTVSIDESFDIPSAEICKLMLVALKGAAPNNPYLCDTLVNKPASVGYTFTSATPVACQGVNLTIGDPALTGYTYSWDNTYTTSSTTAQPTFNYPTSSTISGASIDVPVPVTITRVGGCTVATELTVTVKSVPAVSIANAVANEGGSLTFTVTLIDAPSCPSATVSVQCTTIDNTAVAPGDYTTKTQTLSFAPGETSKTFTVATLADNILEGTETMYARLSSPVGCKLGAATQATGTITDRTLGDVIVEKIADAAEPTTPGKFRIRFSNSAVTATEDVEVSYTVGIATEGVDFTIPTIDQSPITIPRGNNGVDVNIRPINNFVVEGSRPVQIIITSVTNPF